MSRLRLLVLCFLPFAVVASLILILRHPIEHELPPSLPHSSSDSSGSSAASAVDETEAVQDSSHHHSVVQQQQQQQHEEKGEHQIVSYESQSLQQPQHERLHIALISHGWHTAPHYHDDRTIKGPTMSLKMCVAGILKYTTSPVTLYFVTGERDEEPIERLMQNIKYWRRSLEWRFVRLDEEKLDSWMEYIGHRASHRTGRAGNIKFFYPLVFPQLDRLLMLDTDVLIDHDMTALWMHFRHFEPRQLFAMAPQWSHVHPTKDNQFNAGVMLLRMDRMREAGWLDVAKAAIANWNKKMSPPCCTHGDQTVFHMIRFLRPAASLGRSSSAWIPRHWNINKCHGYQGIRSPSSVRDGQGDRLPKHIPFVGLVHIGCCKKCTRQKIGPRWARLVDKLNGTDLDSVFRTPSEELSQRVSQLTRM